MSWKQPSAARPWHRYWQQANKSQQSKGFESLGSPLISQLITFLGKQYPQQPNLALAAARVKAILKRVKPQYCKQAIEAILRRAGVS